MWRLLQWIFYGHFHKWKIIEQGTIYRSNFDKRPVGHYYILQCDECGTVKTKNCY